MIKLQENIFIFFLIKLAR